MEKTIPTITKKQLIEALESYPDDYRISFGGLQFYRAKLYGNDLIHIEFNQTVYLDNDGRVVVENH